MLKVFMVITILGRVVETVGPLPGDPDVAMDRCEARKVSETMRIHAEHGDKKFTLDDASKTVITVDDIAIACFRGERPQLDSAFP